MICDYCKRPSHTRDRCYKLHGFPPNTNRPPNNNQPYKQNNQNFKGMRLVANVHDITGNVMSSNFANESANEEEHSQSN